MTVAAMPDLHVVITVDTSAWDRALAEALRMYGTRTSPRRPYLSRHRARVVTRAKQRRRW